MFVDKAGTTVAVLDDNDFYPWGGVVPGVGKTTSNNTIKFIGQYRDSESQLDYFGARYYSNAIGRFMSPDWAAAPITVPYAKFGDPQSLNLYSYVENGPVNRIDADGHEGIFRGWDGLRAGRDLSSAPGISEVTEVEVIPDGLQQHPDTGNANPGQQQQQSNVPESARVNRLTVRQIAGIVYNENRDVAPGDSSAEQLQAAKTAQAHAIINADVTWGRQRTLHAQTAPWRVPHAARNSVQFRQALAAARAAYREYRSGVDPTGGRTFYNNRFEGQNLNAPRANGNPRNPQSQTPFHTYGPFTVGGGQVWTVIYNDWGQNMKVKLIFLFLTALITINADHTQELTRPQMTDMLKCALNGGGGWVNPNLYADGNVKFNYKLLPSEDMDAQKLYVAFWNSDKTEGTLLIFNFDPSVQPNTLTLVNEGNIVTYKGRLDIWDLLGGMGVYRPTKALLYKLQMAPLIVVPAEQDIPSANVCRTPSSVDTNK
jgi:RHS repeat-associated protein